MLFSIILYWSIISIIGIVTVGLMIMLIYSLKILCFEKYTNPEILPILYQQQQPQRATKVPLETPIPPRRATNIPYSQQLSPTPTATATPSINNGDPLLTAVTNSTFQISRLIRLPTLTMVDDDDVTVASLQEESICDISYL